jgi:hypothetical protein
MSCPLDYGLRGWHVQLKTDRFIAAVLKESSRGDEGRTIRGASGGWFDHRGEFFWLTSSQISLPDRGVTDRQVIPFMKFKGETPCVPFVVCS